MAFQKKYAVRALSWQCFCPERRLFLRAVCRALPRRGFRGRELRGEPGDLRQQKGSRLHQNACFIQNAFFRNILLMWKRSCCNQNVAGKAFGILCHDAPLSHSTVTRRGGGSFLPRLSWSRKGLGVARVKLRTQCREVSAHLEHTVIDNALVLVNCGNTSIPTHIYCVQLCTVKISFLLSSCHVEKYDGND